MYVKKINSMTNKTYQVEDFILKVFKEDTKEYLDRGKELAILNVVSENGLTAKVLYSDEDIMMLSFLHGYRDFDYDIPQDYYYLGEVLARLHAIDAAPLPEAYLRTPVEEIQTYVRMYTARGLETYPDLFAIREEMESFVREEQYKNLSITHGDISGCNAMVGEHDAKLIDFEYACVMNRFWDLGNFISETYIYMDAPQESSVKLFLRGYEDAAGVKLPLYEIGMWAAFVDYLYSYWALATCEAEGDERWVYGRERARRAKEHFEQLQAGRLPLGEG